MGGFDRRYGSGDGGGGGGRAGRGGGAPGRRSLTDGLAPRGGGESIASPVLGRVEATTGADLGDARVHTDGEAQATAAQFGACALTVGSDIYFGTGQYQPGTGDGDRLLAHELAHVAQQSGGAPSAQFQLAVSQRGDAAEVEADLIADAALTGGGRVAATHTGPAVHRYPGSTPTAVSNPNALIPVADLIRYVEDVERSYPADTPEEIISRIRVLYYSGNAFDQLIPDAHTSDRHWAVHPDFGWYEDRNIDNASSATRDHLTARADENAIGDNPSPYVVLPGGQRLDLGHMLLGLDALIHPRTSIPYTSFSVGNIDPASFVADLALASVWTTQHAEEGAPRSGAPRTASSASLADYWAMSAPVEDLLGDVDSFGMHDAYTHGGGARLSELLRRYYLGTSTAAAGVDRRWQTFCTGAGLTYTGTGASITFAPAVRTSLITRVDHMSDLVNAETSGAIWGTLVGPTTRAWPHSGAVVDRFLDYVKTNLAAELARHP